MVFPLPLSKNCEHDGVKLMRKFYGTRPYFLPPMVESQDSNWLPFEEHSVVWLAQVKGSVSYRLEPDPICETTCKPIDVTLKPGETLVVPQLKNSKDSEPAVVVAATGTWD
ncbi:Hypp840 [Branchiostoma lanceolatum]|uniref:Hypp840 protein n=1 Tax=Branchiostoma lanceolatum TaxID=7740 RepID=A0A8J9YM62_BRALA|nr:Hypp840 [Branchiostoma lanceolatum]